MQYEQVFEPRDSAVLDAALDESSTQSSSTRLRLVTDESLARIEPTSSALLPEIVHRLLKSKRSAHTQKTYEVGLRAFFGGQLTREKVEAFLSLSVPEITFALLDFKEKMRLEGKSDATINNRVAAVRSLLQIAFRAGMCVTDGRGLVDSEKVEALRDTRGINLESVNELFKAPERKYQKRFGKAAKTALPVLRDYAILRLWCENAMRRGAVHKLNVEDFSHREKRLWVKEKGRGAKAPKTISKTTADAIGAYILAAGHANTEGPLFRNFDRNPANNGKRLSEKSFYMLSLEYGKMIGVEHLNPHKLRHTAITLFLADGGDILYARDMAGHRDVKTTMIYDDNRKDRAGEAVNQLSNLFHSSSKRKR